jgi:hypothetical protein
MKKLSVLFLLFTLILVNCNSDKVAPRVVSTFPVNGSTDVDPSINQITDTFSEEMMDNSWSWAQNNDETFPTIVAQIYYTENYTKNILPVKLEPNKEYVIWINSEHYRNFKDKNGNSAIPFQLKFKTR